MKNNVDTDRISHLDGMRGVLAVCVFLNHLFGSMQGWKTDRPFSGASLCVDFFFVLSGYVLTHVINNKPIAWLPFCLKRLYRLLPLHLLCIIALLCVFYNNTILGTFVPQWWHTLDATLVMENVLFLHGVISFEVLNPPSWSISIEFFLSSTVLFFIASIKNRKYAVMIAMALAVAAYAVIFTTEPHNLHFSEDIVPFVNAGVLRGIGGMMLGYAMFVSKPILSGLGAAKAGALSIPLAAITAYAVYADTGANRLDLLYLGAFCALILVLNGRDFMSKLLSINIMQWLGNISFSVYLIHTAILSGMNPCRYYDAIGLWFVPFATAIVLTVASIITFGFEAPVRRMLYATIRSFGRDGRAAARRGSSRAPESVAHK